MRIIQIALWMVIACSCATVLGCGASRRALEGTVTINGTPMDLGMITFTPADPAAGQTSVGTKVTDGKYYLDATRGPLPGKYHVEIYWSKKTGRQVKNSDGGMKDEMKEGLPAKYNTNTELTTEITSWTSRADFNLTP